MTELRRLKTRKGKIVDTPYDDVTAMTKLRALVKTGELNSGFARDLAVKTRMSDDQMTWVHALVLDHEAEESVSRALADGPDLKRIVDLMEIAGASLKWPKIRLVVGDGDSQVRLKLSRCGSRARHPGAVRIVGVPGDALLGFILPDGMLRPTGPMLRDADAMRIVQDALRSFGDDPAAYGRSHGLRFGWCCFCGRELTTAESTSVGYGPICAGHYGLPWGPDVQETKIERARRLSQSIEEIEHEIGQSREDDMIGEDKKGWD